jgi:hypothetical protein
MRDEHGQVVNAKRVAGSAGNAGCWPHGAEAATTISTAAFLCTGLTIFLRSPL